MQKVDLLMCWWFVCMRACMCVCVCGGGGGGGQDQHHTTTILFPPRLSPRPHIVSTDRMQTIVTES